MVTIKDILRRVPVLGDEIKINEQREQGIKRLEEEERRVEELLPEALRRILTISPEQFASMYGRNVTDYEPVGMQVTSPFRHDAKYSRDLASVMLLLQMRQTNIDSVVAANFDTVSGGMGSLLNPNRYQTAIYGTGLKLKTDIVPSVR